MTRTPLVLLTLAALAACASPRDQCLKDANRGLSTLDRLIAKTQGNINRGFAIAEVQDIRVFTSTCVGTNEDGTRFRIPCDETETFTRQEPVTINIAEERVKLAQLQERRANMTRAAQARIQNCVATHPE